MRDDFLENKSEEGNNIKRVVEYIADQYNVTHVYLEVIHKETAEFIKQRPQHRTKYLSDLAKAKYLLRIAKNDAQLVQYAREEIAKIEASEERQQRWMDKQLGLLLPLYKRGLIKIKAGTDEELLNRAIALEMRKIFLQEQNLEEQRALSKERERKLLEIGSRQPITLTRFDGEYHWWKTVQERNEQHPDQQYCLIEITPQGYNKKTKIDEGE